MKLHHTEREKLNRAISLACYAHDGQVRKGSSLPYISHPVAVMASLAGSHTDILCAAVLHDAIEDAPDRISLEEIREQLGETVATWVHALTKSRAIDDWYECGKSYLSQISLAGEEVIVIAVADKLHNVQCTLDDYALVGDEIWKRFRTGKEGQIWWHRKVLELASSRCAGHPLVEEYQVLVGLLETL
ncbi:HD domain-containing protein [Corynebacterium sp. ES2715-CONJ3]|uniref:HD domain-containing protein n=1 Tax=Corynebacterium sp. ES2715-CONJ3 TaxID=2974028 RepID=UPI00216A3D69|nr:HD domain-containing protein [Corynebacterium sp. ES2715-CONJ3]MCS4492519.1 HD domain-containing protein [Corynebacterium sp. ES2715-CONJ3]